MSFLTEKQESIFILIALIVLIFAFYFFKEAQMMRTPRNISIVENNFHFELSRQEQIIKTASRENILEFIYRNRFRLTPSSA